MQNENAHARTRFSGSTNTRFGGNRRSSSGGSSYGQRSGGFRRSSGGGSRSGGGFSRNRRNYKREYIRHEQYIAKAEAPLETVEYVPANKFSDFDLHPLIQKNIAFKKYVNPTRIQDQAIPHVLQGKDVLGLASTGSGKTAAFLLPLINKVMNSSLERVLIIVPTRELATQIQDELRAFAFGTRVNSVVVIGGSSMGMQINLLRRNPQFIIGTPGRLKDLFNRRVMNLSQFKNIVLDEVDKMLDMGFIEDIRYLVSQLNTERQSLFFSATMTPEAESIARSLLKDPVKVQTELESAKKNIEQNVVVVAPSKTKIETLHDLLIQEDFKKVLIFSNTKIGSDRLATELLKRGFKVDAIHGDKSQFKRDQVINKFKKDVITILVATDVAARGIDIPDITHVINYDEPANYKDYIHRIGRTGRVGKKGTALTFVD